jgi:hypothetical protein
MLRPLTCSLLLAAFLSQGWAQAGMVMPAGAASLAECMDHAVSDDGCDCCPDAVSAAGACAVLCAAAAALAVPLPEVTVIHGQFRASFHPPVRAGPRYLPLNPPPIA